MKLRTMLPAPVPEAVPAVAPRVRRPAVQTRRAVAAFGNRAFAPRATAVRAAPPRPIVEDEEGWLSDAAKPAFLNALRESVERATAESLAGTGFTPANCPYLSYWFAHYGAQPASHIENAIRRYAPEAAGVDGPAAVIELVTARIQRGVSRWAVSGEISGVPPGVPLEVPGTTPAELDPRLLRLRLHSGQPLPAPVRGRMESAFRLSFPEVRIHTNAAAGELVRQSGAPALAVGSDIAFAPGEFRPGTPQGDALLAHELAHAAQQKTASLDAPVSPSAAAEQDATRSATSVIANLWGGIRSMVHAPALRTGLALQRCGGAQTGVRPGAPVATGGTTIECPTTPLEGDAWQQARAHAFAESTPVDMRATEQGRLVASAVCGLGIRVHMATQTHPDQAHPDDYAQAPLVNFDPRMHEKRKYNRDTAIGTNPGYTISRGENDAFCIIGPNAISPASPLQTRQYAQHELYHAAHHTGGAGGAMGDDAELETWTNDFVNYFHQYFQAGLPIPERQSFSPLMMYYGRASETAKTASRTRLLAYYRNPPDTVADPEHFRMEFRQYLTRFVSNARSHPDRNPALANDLLAQIGPAH